MLWCRITLALNLIKFENAYMTEHGYRPLNPGPPNARPVLKATPNLHSEGAKDGRKLGH